MSAPRALRALARPSLIRPTTLPSTRASPIAARAFSQSMAKRGGGHESHYDSPQGWLWGVKPGEEYKKEGWENATFYVLVPMMVLFVGVYAFKPDTRYVETGEIEGKRNQARWHGVVWKGMRKLGEIWGWVWEAESRHEEIGLCKGLRLTRL